MHGVSITFVISFILLSIQSSCSRLSIFGSLSLSILANSSLYSGEALSLSKRDGSIYSFIPGCQLGGRITSIPLGRLSLNQHISNIAVNSPLNSPDSQENGPTHSIGRVSIASILSAFHRNGPEEGAYGPKNESQGTHLGFTRVPSLVKVTGWVQSLRKIKGGDVLFIDINDGSSPEDIQVVVDTLAPRFASVVSLERGAAISVVGTLDWRRGKPSEKSLSDVDLYVEDETKGHKIVTYPNGPTEINNPVMPSTKYHFEYLRNHPHLRSRNKTMAAIFRIRGELIEFTHKFFKEKGYTCTTTPLLTSVDSEGLGELFQATFLPNGDDRGKETKDDPTYLSVSGQLELESLCCSLGNVWKFGPAFRADRSDTPRHLSEFWMLEAEAICVTLKDIILFIQEYIQGCSELVLSKCADDVKHLDEFHGNEYRNSLAKMASSKIEVVEYSDAVELLNGMADEDPTCEHSKISLGENLSAAHERALIKRFGLVAVTNYPEAIKPFYMKSSADGTVQNFDILAPIANELAGGSIREDVYDMLVKKMAKSNISGQEYDRYLQLRQFGNVPHGGFGIGFDRLVMLMTGVQNIRDVIPYPRIRTKDSIL